MKKVKQLTVKVTYTVGLGDFDMPEDIYNKLVEASENFKTIDGESIDDVSEWLGDNIKERDAMEWSFEIEEID